MISCTEFIPLYSEFFKYLEKAGGHDAVLKYWYYISDNSIGDKTNPNSLVSFIERDGPFEGSINYWKHTLTEEACDLLKIYDYDRRYVYTHMRRCPSRGMLNDLKHIEPYYDYCEHCNVIYKRQLEKYGVVFKMDHSNIDRAECTSILYEEGNEPTCDVTATEGRTVVDMKAEDNKYLHRDFHLLGDLALKYCGEQFGDEGVIDFLTNYTKNYYSPQIADIRKRGLIAVKEWIEKVYEVEEAGELLHTELEDGTLTVKIDRSPVIEYMHSLGQQPTKYYIEETRTLYAVVARESGLGFELCRYNEDGGAEFRFTK